jgi:hypothetical protein
MSSSHLIDIRLAVIHYEPPAECPAWRRLHTQRAHGSSTLGLPLTGGADKSLARRGRKQATATEDFYFHIFHL